VQDVEYWMVIGFFILSHAATPCEMSKATEATESD